MKLENPSEIGESLPPLAKSLGRCSTRVTPREQEQTESQTSTAQTIQTDQASRLTLRLLDELIGGNATDRVGMRL